MCLLSLLTLSTLSSATPRPDVRRFSGEQPGNVAMQLVLDMLKAQRTLALTGEQVTNLYDPSGVTTSSEQTYTRDGVRGIRLDYHSPVQLSAESRGDNGHLMWHYYAGKKPIEVVQSQLAHLRSEISAAEQLVRSGRVTLTYLGEDSLAGRTVEVVQAAPLVGDAGQRKFWIDPSNGAQLRIVVLGPSGSPISDSYFTQVAYNPALPTGTFDPPATGTSLPAPSEQVTQNVHKIPPGNSTALGFDILEPSYLPQGFAYSAAQMFRFRGRPAIGIRYVNGVTVMSIYETIRADTSQVASHYRLQREGTLTGVFGPLQIVIAGNVDPNDLVKTFQSLH